MNLSSWAKMNVDTNSFSSFEMSSTGAWRDTNPSQDMPISLRAEQKTVAVLV